MTDNYDETVSAGRHGPRTEGQGIGTSPYGQGASRDYADGEGYSDLDGGYASKSGGHGDLQCWGSGKSECIEHDNLYYRDNL